MPVGEEGMPSSHPNAVHGSSPLGGGGSRSDDATWTLNKSWVAIQSWVDVTPKPHLFLTALGLLVARHPG